MEPAPAGAVLVPPRPPVSPPSPAPGAAVPERGGRGLRGPPFGSSIPKVLFGQHPGYHGRASEDGDSSAVVGATATGGPGKPDCLKYGIRLTSLPLARSL